MADLIKERNIDPEFLKQMHLGKLTEFDFEDSLRLKLANLGGTKVAYDDTALVQKINALESTVTQYKNLISASTDFYSQATVDSKIAEVNAFISALRDDITELKNTKISNTYKITYDMLSRSLQALIDNGATKDTRDLATMQDLEDLRQEILNSVEELRTFVNDLSSTYIVHNEVNAITYDMLTDQVKNLLNAGVSNITLDMLDDTLASQLQQVINNSSSVAGDNEIVRQLIDTLTRTNDDRKLAVFAEAAGGSGASDANIRLAPILTHDAVATDDKDFYDALVAKVRTFTASTPATDKILNYSGSTYALDDMNYIIYLHEVEEGEECIAEYWYNTLMDEEDESQQFAIKQTGGVNDNPLLDFSGTFLYDPFQAKLYYISNREEFLIVSHDPDIANNGGSGTSSSHVQQKEITVSPAVTGFTVTVNDTALPITQALINVLVKDRKSGSPTYGMFIPLHMDPSEMLYYGCKDGDSNQFVIFNHDTVARTVRYSYYK